MLRTDDQSPAGEPFAAQVDALLQFTGGHHAVRAVAGHQPGRAGPFPAAGGQQQAAALTVSTPRALVIVTVRGPTG